MAAGSKASDPNAIWHSNRAKESKAPRAAAKLQAATSARKTAKVTSEAMPRFVPPQLCKTLSRPPQGDDWVHEIKFDGYRMQLRVEDGAATLRTRKGLDWTGQVSRRRRRPRLACPTASSTARSWRSMTAAAPNFAALQAALSDGRSQDLVYFAFDLLFDRGEDLRTLAALRAQGAPERRLLAKSEGR